MGFNGNIHILHTHLLPLSFIQVHDTINQQLLNEATRQKIFLQANLSLQRQDESLNFAYNFFKNLKTAKI